MKKFLMMVLGIEALRTQLHLMKQELEEMREANKRMQIKLSSMARHEGVMLDKTQASGIAQIVEDFRARNRKVITREG